MSQSCTPNPGSISAAYLKLMREDDIISFEYSMSVKHTALHINDDITYTYTTVTTQQE